jgi:C4-dicarboxylate transporter, DctM subunit
MYDATDMMLLVGTLLLTLVFSGIHIAVALGLASMLGIYLLTQDFSTMLSFVSNTSYEALA